MGKPCSGSRSSIYTDIITRSVPRWRSVSLRETSGKVLNLAMLGLTCENDHTQSIGAALMVWDSIEVAARFQMAMIRRRLSSARYAAPSHAGAEIPSDIFHSSRVEYVFRLR